MEGCGFLLKGIFLIMFYIKKKVYYVYFFSKIGDLWYLKKCVFLYYLLSNIEGFIWINLMLVFC